MIEFKKAEPAKVQKKKEPAQKEVFSIPFFAMDSSEVDFIRQKIEQNKKYLTTCKTASLYAKVEKDTLFMENNILPVLLAKTNLFFNDSTKKFVGALDKSIQSGCNAMLYYAPISDDYNEHPKLATVNPKEGPDKIGNSVKIFAVNTGESSEMFDFPYTKIEL